MPVLAVGGGLSSGAQVEETMRAVANDVTGLELPGVGHFVPEEALLAFLR